MGWVKIKSIEGANSSALAEWQIDSATDIQTPPSEIAVGSIASTADGEHTYRKSNDGTWTEVASSGGGGGGGGASVTIVNMDMQTGALDMKAGALLEACASGLVNVKLDIENTAEVYMPIITAGYTIGEGYTFSIMQVVNPTVFEAATADDYPSTSIGGGGNGGAPVGN